MQQEKCYRFQSTLPLWGATGSLNCAVVGTPISIHAPLAGSDLALRHMAPAYLISIHAPLAGSDGRLLPMLPFPPISIHAPLAGSDLPIATLTFSGSNFNPRSPCGERPTTWEAYVLPRQFQSTLPLRGATLLGDPLCQWTSYFNPRSPCGERRHRSSWWCCCRRFQSTLPLRGATREQIFLLRMQDISIHAPLAGSDMTEIFMAWSK